ncbi:hypothetical protein SAMN04490186_5914 [Pseudomonas grimontii]|uniref:Uncharacterized protein n=1 Tax=Pseudomonas grimontii TaxID=129847 RepID=A0A1H1IMG2_9PSED|nr:hypothetical protein [Pseudomonas grimontii]TWR70534.1 hypothetical protein FIV39_04130 [Pseudomonas grimontii]SDR38873.1 hypothetical protein SAMN04490186_5914 [Pseudomonas grimontii]
MHTLTALWTRAAAISVILIWAVDAVAECRPGSVNAEHSCGKDNYDPNYKNRKKPAASGRTDAGAAADTIQSIGTYLQQQDDQSQNLEHQQRIEQDRIYEEQQRNQKAQFQQNYQELDTFESSMDGDGWESRAAAASPSKGPSKGKVPAQTSSTGDCNCREVAGVCTATVVVVKKNKTGADFKVTSSVPRCSRVNYYIDSTPRLTVLINTNTAMEHAAGLTEISNKTFEVESCQVCASK